MILYGKVKGIFNTLPKESMSLDWICKLTDSNKEDVKPILERLVKEDIIKGKKKFRLKVVPKYIKNIPIKK